MPLHVVLPYLKLLSGYMLVCCKLVMLPAAFDVPHHLQMSEDERKRLTWEDATQRFLDVAELSPAELANPVERGFDRAAWMLHNSLNGMNLSAVYRLQPPLCGHLYYACPCVLQLSVHPADLICSFAPARGRAAAARCGGWHQHAGQPRQHRDLCARRGHWRAA